MSTPGRVVHWHPLIDFNTKKMIISVKICWGILWWGFARYGCISLAIIFPQCEEQMQKTESRVVDKKLQYKTHSYIINSVYWVITNFLTFFKMTLHISHSKRTEKKSAFSAIHLSREKKNTKRTQKCITKAGSVHYWVLKKKILPSHPSDYILG